MRRANGRGRGGGGRAARTLWPDVDDKALLVAPLVAGDEQLGIICCLAHDRQFAEEDAELLGAVANQTAVGLKKTELIERLTAENLVKDMFDALAAGSVEAAEAKAGEAGCDLSQPHLFVHVERAAQAPAGGRIWSELAGRLQEQLRRLGTAGVPRLSPRPGARADSAAGGKGQCGGEAPGGVRAAGAGGRAGSGIERGRSRRIERPEENSRGRRRRSHRQIARSRGRRRLL